MCVLARIVMSHKFWYRLYDYIFGKWIDVGYNTYLVPLWSWQVPKHRSWSWCQVDTSWSCEVSALNSRSLPGLFWHLVDQGWTACLCLSIHHVASCVWKHRKSWDMRTVGMLLRERQMDFFVPVWFIYSLLINRRHDRWWISVASNNNTWILLMQGLTLRLQTLVASPICCIK